MIVFKYIRICARSNILVLVLVNIKIKNQDMNRKGLDNKC